MASFGPWERRPHLAVAVSGGADSMALALIAQGWAAQRGGAVLALTVDHRLRADSAPEAARVADRLGRRGIAHRTLVWDGPKPGSGLQAAARAARHRLLGRACEEAGVLHLLMAHHRGDQAETVLIRREDSSGPDGLAGMAAEVATAWGRLIRPLLDVPKERLIAALVAGGEDWIEDPSNQNPHFARVRHRRSLALEPGREAALASAAALCGAERARREAAVADLLVSAARLLPEGFLWLDPGRVRAAPAPIAIRALAQCLRAVGAPPAPMRGERLTRLLDWLKGDRLGAGRTLAGCRIVPEGGRVLIVREAERTADELPALPGVQLWDRRFAVTLPAATDPSWRLRRLAPASKTLALDRVPRPARGSLPAVYDLDGLVALPHLCYVRSDVPAAACPSAIRFTPPQGLTGAEFRVASPGLRGI